MPFPPELPADDPMLSPVLLRRDLLASGLDDREVRRMVERHELVRVRHGAYVAADAWASLDAAGRHGVLTRAVIRQGRTELVASHTSALPEWGCPVWGFDLSMVDVTRPDGRAGRREAGVRQHRGGLQEGDVVRRHGIQVTAPTRLAVEATMAGGTEAALCVVNDLLHRGLTTVDEVMARYRHVDPAQTMQAWPSTLTTEHVLRLADPRIESPGETRFFHLVWRAGLPLPVPQVEVRDRAGRVVARLDFAWPDLGVFAEFDGKVKYTRLLAEGDDVTDVVLREKRREQLVCELTGWRPIRIDWTDLERPQRTSARLRDLLRPDLRAG